MSSTRSQTFTEEMRAAIQSAVSQALVTHTQTLSDLKSEIASMKHSLIQKDNRISELEQRIEQLGARSDTHLLERVQLLESAHDSLEQYGRRLNIRIENVPEIPDETPLLLETKVLGLLSAAGACISPSDVQRLHRSTALRSRNDSSRSDARSSQVIVRLNNWKARESAHNARNTARSQGHPIKQDLTSIRREMIAEANVAIREWTVSEPVYCYASINCQVVMRRGRTVRRINSEDDLKSALAFFRPQ